MNGSEMTFSFAGREFDATTGIASFSYDISGAEPLHFVEKITFPKGYGQYDTAAFERSLDALALVLGVSYWKIFCPAKIEVRFAALSLKQAEFWNTLYTKGLGEFFYRNQIDFHGLVRFPFLEKPQALERGKDKPGKKGALILVGGGKDSPVAFELSKKAGIPLTQFVVNSERIKDAMMDIAGVPRFVAKRELDSQVFELSKRPDAHNGHVPATAIVQAIALCTAILHGFGYVIASNEESANYGNVSYLGEEINHQWSKSIECEKLWQDYIDASVGAGVRAFSLLRPLSEFKIIQLFAKHSKYFDAFSSCNKNFTLRDKQIVRWCCECPKCAFVFAGLAAFLPREQVIRIFGENLFAKKELISLYRELLGLENIKPFECVATPEEVRLMLWLASEKGSYKGDAVMNMFECDCKDIILDIKKSMEKLLSIGSLETIPEEFKMCLDEN